MEIIPRFELVVRSSTPISAIDDETAARDRLRMNRYSLHVNLNLVAGLICWTRNFLDSCLHRTNQKSSCLSFNS